MAYVVKKVGVDKIVPSHPADVCYRLSESPVDAAHNGKRLFAFLMALVIAAWLIVNVHVYDGLNKGIAIGDDWNFCYVEVVGIPGAGCEFDLAHIFGGD